MPLSGLLILAIYAALAIGQIYSLRMNRATIALAGAALLVALGILTESEAIHAIDVGTILLLAAMMVINVNLRMAGFFRFVTSHTLRIARTPQMLLALVIISAGTLSAIFLNDPVCLMMTPLVVDLTKRLGRNPIPYLIGLGTAANIGSVATITGNPQNLIIGQASQIPYVRFLLYLAPVAILGLIAAWFIILLVYRSEFRGALALVELPPPRPYTPLLNRTLLVVLGLMIAFLVGAPIVTSACVVAALLLISRLRPHKLLALDWDLLAFFAGLFAITHAIETTGISAQFFAFTEPILSSGVWGLSLVTGVLSNIISNVPAVLLMQTMVTSEKEWLTLAMSSTLAGNLTLLGSAATLIVAEVAKRDGI